MMWILLRNGWFFIPIPKNASTAIREHRLDVKKHKVKPSSKSFAVIRHPLDRLVSFYENKWEGSWDSLIDFVIKDPRENMHTRPQVDFIEPRPTNLVKFEFVGSFCNSIGIPLNVHNASERTRDVYFTPQQESAVMGVYSDDFCLWEGL